MSFLDWFVVVIAVCYIIFAIDDLIFDATYWFGKLMGLVGTSARATGGS